jgi:hypothetical protein
VRFLLTLGLFLAATRFAAAATAPVPDGLADAVAARAMLGTDTWARLVLIQNANSGSGWYRGVYPKAVYGVVFEMSGILWFYTDTNGTQSLSLTLGTLETDKAAPGRLFRAIDRGFGRWSWVDEPPSPWVAAPRRPPNGCFIESVAALYRRLAVGATTASPRLLSYYVDTPTGRLGHTVLLFGAGSGLEAVDFDTSERPVPIPPGLGDDPRSISSFLWGRTVSSARTLPILCSRNGAPPARWAALPAGLTPAG